MTCNTQRGQQWGHEGHVQSCPLSTIVVGVDGLGRLLWARFLSNLPSLLRETIADGMTLPPSIRCFLPTPLDSSGRRSDIVPGKKNATGHAILPSRTQSNTENHSS